MLQLKWIKQNDEKVQTAADQKGINISIKELLILDEEKRKLRKKVEDLRFKRNKLSQEIGLLKRSGEDGLIEELKNKVKDINEKLLTIEFDLKNVENQFDEMMLQVPNIISEDTPIGSSDKDNVEIRRVGEPMIENKQLKDHVALGEMHDMIDIARGVKTGGSRSYFLKGIGVLLHRAVEQLAFDILIKKGLTPLEVPVMVRTDALTNTGYFPLGKDQTYKLVDENKWLVGSSEVPLVSYYANEIVDVDLPLKFSASSKCFRSEVGSSGRDVHGLYRVHQFEKVEQVVLCKADEEISNQLLLEITSNAEEILQLLELPYRVMAVCSGDMSQKTYKQFDIETWMPSRNAYGETHSSSNLLDFQTLRSNIRYRDENGELNFCYSLNNTAIASPRILIPLLENHQQEDGSIQIPKALQKYMNGMEKIVPVKMKCCK
ncbi:serine--tRNA ligase [Chengkuizengella axinellae]|uniref:Serine--tRNA ligase n=1 Tax=Chengkuizengella axinellae TaxID=3064388 RepID=A0ABT9IXL6_9BACL|nr:serine--tRNA ligase [Chengkuizengella sp. 2205SS18-9]MDP5273540.1 serine--tRNA ligase [Chengkuizengella sp. 2205SS18-9]